MGMPQTSSPTGHILFFYTNPNTGKGIPANVVWRSEDGSSFDIELLTGGTWMVTAGDLYCEDESGRYLGGPR
jgi:hypothetical protein